MDSMKKMASDAGAFLHRAKQMTEETLGNAEKTELEPRLMHLVNRADATKQWTESIIKNTEVLLQPNPGARVEEFVYKTLKEKHERMTCTEALGNTMIAAGHDYGKDTSIGKALTTIGVAEQNLGFIEKEFCHATTASFVTQLKNFMEGDMKTIQKEKKTLENKRLDLDVVKNKIRKTSTPQLEGELRAAQSEFDRQAEVTRLLCESIEQHHDRQLRCLKEFVDNQHLYFKRCLEVMDKLKKDVEEKVGGVDTGPSVAAPYSVDSIKKAKVLYDYDAGEQNEELALIADEIISVYCVPNMDVDWMMGENSRGRKGRVPVAYLEYI